VTQHSITAMLSGMVILVLPAFLIVSGIAIVAYRRRNRSTQD